MIRYEKIGIYEGAGVEDCRIFTTLVLSDIHGTYITGRSRLAAGKTTALYPFIFSYISSYRRGRAAPHYTSEIGYFICL